jgi:hypothetical protein
MHWNIISAMGCSPHDYRLSPGVVLSPGWPQSGRPLSNDNAVLSAKLDQLRLDGDLHNFAGFAAAADIINAGDEFTKRPGSFRGIIFHNVKRRREGRIDAMGCVPHLCFGELGIGLTFRAVGVNWALSQRLESLRRGIIGCRVE